MQKQQLFEPLFVSQVNTNNYSKCTRSGAGKCMCKRCQGAALPLNRNSSSNPGYGERWLFEAPFPSQTAHSSASTQENYMDAMTAPPFRSIPGGRKGRVRRDISPWPSLLKRAMQAIQNAMRHLGPPLNSRDFDLALLQAETLLKNAMQEAKRVMSGARQSDVLDQLSNAVVRIQAARAQARGASIFGGRSLIDPKISLHGAINHIQQARQAVGLQ